MLAKMWSKQNTLSLLVEVQTCTNLAVSLKGWNSSTSRPSYTTPGHTIQNMLHNSTKTLLFNYVHSSFIHNSQKLETTRSPSTEEWIRKIYIYSMQYYSSIKNKDIMNFAGKWMELENIILSEVTQIQKDIHDMYSFVSGY